MPLLEREIEDIIVNSDQNLLRERGLTCLNYHHILRQVNLNSYGIADFVTVKFYFDLFNKTHAKIIVYELKREEINVDALMQAAGYKKCIEKYMELFNFDRFDVSVCLIGSSMDVKSNFVFLAEMAGVSVYTFSFGLDGFFFKDQSVSGFTISSVDHSKVYPVKIAKLLHKNFYKRIKILTEEVQENPFL